MFNVKFSDLIQFNSNCGSVKIASSAFVLLLKFK